MKIIIEIEGEEKAISVDDARKIYDELSGLFERKANQSPVLPDWSRMPIGGDGPYWANAKHGKTILARQS